MLLLLLLLLFLLLILLLLLLLLLLSLLNNQPLEELLKILPIVGSFSVALKIFGLWLY